MSLLSSVLRASALLWIGATFAHPGVALSRESEASGEYNPNAFLTDEASTTEINRINSLQPSKSPVLNEATREEINAAARLYSQDLIRLNELIAAPLDSIKKDTEENLAKEFKALTDSNNEEDAARARNLIAGSYGYLVYLQKRLNANAKGITEPGSEESNSESALALTSNATNFYGKYRQKDKADVFYSDLKRILAITEEQLSKDQAQAKSIVPRIARILEAWGKYKATLEKTIEDSASPAGKIADQLWIIVHTER
jgi:hypothetical protein